MNHARNNRVVDHKKMTKNEVQKEQKTAVNTAEVGKESAATYSSDVS